MKAIQAVALCRVSTLEQRIGGHSLESQSANTINEAGRLGAEIIKTWSLDISRRKGKSDFKKKDLEEIRAFCRKNRGVKYLLVDKVNRFMREIDIFYWYIVEFRKLGVTVWFCAPEQQDLNGDGQVAAIKRFLAVHDAENDNKERALTTASRMQFRYNAGYSIRACRIGYMIGIERGIHVPDPARFDLLRQAGLEVASGLYTPGQALHRLNQHGFTNTAGNKWKIDKFKSWLSDVYLMGVIEVNGPFIKAYCANGLHQKMFNADEFDAIQIALGRGGKRIFKHLQFNPEFPLNKLLQCGDCGGKYTGSNQNNGRGNIYPRYRCRGCKRQYHREDVVAALNNVLTRIALSEDVRRDLMSAMSEVWEQKHLGTKHQINVLESRRTELTATKSSLIISHANADEASKPDIWAEVEKTKARIVELNDQIEDLADYETDFIEFVSFTLKMIQEWEVKWWELEPEDRLMCQQMLFPAGIFFNSEKKVGTPKISAIFTLARQGANKKDHRYDRKSLLVELRGIAPRSVRLPIKHYRYSLLLILAKHYLDRRTNT